MALPLCLLLLVLATGARAQPVMIPLPAHGSIYTGSVRGMWFTAPTNFTITGLRLPPEAGTGDQYIHLFRINDAAPVIYPTSSTNFTTLAYIQAAPNGVIQNVNIPVSSGQIIGVLGAGGTNTSNSYSAGSMPYPATIGSFPMTLNRILYQGPITAGPAPNYSIENASSISRVEVYYITVYPPCNAMPSALNITTAAMTTPLCTGGTKTIVATDPNFAANISYQWEEANAATGPWSNVSGGTGATSLSYTTAVLNASKWYRVTATCTNTNQSASSVPYQVPVGLPPLGNITGNNTFCPGNVQTYSVPALAGAASYGWSLPGGWTINGNSTGSSVSVTAGNNTGNIQVTAFGNCGASPTQSLAVTFANPDPGISIQATSALPVCAGTTLTFLTNTVSAGTAPSYQWFRNGQPVGGNTPTYTVPNGANGDSIMCLLTSNSNCVDTNEAVSNTVGLQILPTVSPSVTVSANPGTAITPGQLVTFTANPVNGGPTPTYQWKKNNVNIFGATGPTYTTNTLVGGDQIQVQMVSDEPCAAPAITNSDRISIRIATAVANLASVFGLTLSPNPNNGYFTLSGTWSGVPSGKPVRLEVLNMLGQAVYAREWVPAGGTSRVDVQLHEGIANGVYLLRVTAENAQAVQRFEVGR